MTLPSRNNTKVVLDTNVLLFDAMAIRTFRDSDIFIPFSVIEEIDRFKRDMGENGRNARHFSRFVDVLRSQGSLGDGVLIEDINSYVYINQDPSLDRFNQDFENKADNKILATAMVLKEEYPEHEVKLISKDINLRIKADVFKIEATDFDGVATSNIDEVYSGVMELEVEPTVIDEFYKNKAVGVESRLFANQYMVLKDITNPNHSAIGRYDLDQDCIVPLITPVDSVWGIHPRNMEQSFALDGLLNDDVKFVSLMGKAGTGKTLLAIAAGLSKALDEGQFHKLLVSRPIFPMGRDIGYLPGDIGEKLNPWMQPIFDNVEYLMGEGKKAAGRAQELINQGMLNIEPLTYIRGRSIPNQYLIVDEAQNLSPHEIKTIVTRAGEGTKVVLTGDPQQIDNPYVDAASSGLTYSVEKFKAEKIATHITLSKGERSALAELAANIL